MPILDRALLKYLTMNSLDDYDILNEPCPECGSDRTYYLDFCGAFKCEECNSIIDDDYWIDDEDE